jgi:hypothetical protein
MRGSLVGRTALFSLLMRKSPARLDHESRIQSSGAVKGAPIGSRVADFDGRERGVQTS